MDDATGFETVDMFFVLDWMKQRGSFVQLTWDEDDNIWECAWISGGTRHIGRSSDARVAVMAAHMRPRRTQETISG